MCGTNCRFTGRYPTINFFSEGKLAFTYSGGRKHKDFVEFAKDPQEPPPPPPPPKPWQEESGILGLGLISTDSLAVHAQM